MADSDNACSKCQKAFKRKPKGWRRRSCNLLFPEMKGYFCDKCFYEVNKEQKGSVLKKKARQMTPGKSPQTKKLKIGTPVNKLKTKTPHKQSEVAIRNLSRNKYQYAVRSFMLKKGFSRSVMGSFGEIVKTEIKEYISHDSILTQEVTLEKLDKFNWCEVLTQFKQYAPTTTKFLISILNATCRNRVEEEGHVHPVLGLLIAVIANVNSSRKHTFMQKVLSLEMYRNGAPQKLLKMFNHLHLSVCAPTTRKTVDNLVREYKEAMITKKQSLQEMLASGSFRLPTRRRRLFDEGCPEGTSSLKAESKSYTFCWDNTQIEVRSRHQLKEKNVSQMLWALCYATTNRVVTEHLSDKPPSTLAKDIPISVFLPCKDTNVQLRDWLAFQIKVALVEGLPAFNNLKRTTPTIIDHQFINEMSQKSEVINLGVLDENPSTTDGAIGISDFLSTMVPTYPDGRPFTIITHCDGGAFERMVSARKVRAPADDPIHQLLGLEPSAQEFHKRGIMLQMIMDQYFKGESQTERGTLANIKAVLNQHSVKKKVMDCFNHVEDMFDMTCDGYLCLLAMAVLGFETYDEELPFASNQAELENVLNQTVEAILDKIWLQPTEDAVTEVINALVPPASRFDPICCGQDVTGDVVTCSNSNCPHGGHFHAQCIELIMKEVPNSDEDWWCSPGCGIFSRFCTCRRFVAGVTVVECQLKQRCTHGQWFHLECVGLKKKPSKDEVWYCPKCKSEDIDDSVYQYTIGLTWMLINDRLRRHAIRTGNGAMMLQLWKDDGIHFWNHGHNKYLILMHRMTAGVNGWLSERLAADLMWNRTVNIRGGADHNVAKDKFNEFLNNQFKENLKKTNGKYTDLEISRCSFLTGCVARYLDQTFATNVSDCELHQGHGRNKKKEAVHAFLEEYQGDRLCEKVEGRQSRHFSNHNAKQLHQDIKKPADLKARLTKYSRVLDRTRNAANRFQKAPQ